VRNFCAHFVGRKVYRLERAGGEARATGRQLGRVDPAIGLVALGAVH
jgi:hypothetical protein